jgi:hypothetical protein
MTKIALSQENDGHGWRNVFVTRRSGRHVTLPVAVAKLLPVVYSGAIVVVFAIWLKGVPTGKFCVSGADKVIIVLVHGFKLFNHVHTKSCG